MTDFEKTFGAREPANSSAAAAPVARTIGTSILLALLLAYAVSFVMLFPLAQALMEKSAAEGADPVSLEFVSP